MTRKIFLDVLLLGVIMLLICALIFFGLQCVQTVEENALALKNEAAYAVKGLELSGLDYLEKLEDINRVTWIGADGSVLFDSDYPALATNQGGYREVADALAAGTGYVIRNSDSSGSSTMYYAVRCPDGTVLRLSHPLNIFSYALQSVSPVLWALLLVLLIAAVSAFAAAQNILRPINEMRFDDTEFTAVYPELEPLTARIREQQETIRQEMLSRESLRKEFSANVSHELKTPLTSISGFAELMRDGMVPPEKIPEFSGDIYRESRRLIALVDDIMRLSKLDEETGLPDSEPVALEKLAAEVCHSLRPAADQRRLRMTLANAPATVLGARQVLHEMLYNLVDNAIKYNVEEGALTVETGVAENRPYFEVRDTGIGISAADQERVFERFYRVDKSHSKTIGGTGLGLSIVKHGAAYHQAEITLESAPGEGTRVRVTFPEQGQA